jgi:hypothetical protein
MRSLAVLIVATTVEVAHAEPQSSQLVGGLGMSVGRFYPGFHPDDRLLRERHVRRHDALGLRRLAGS